MNQPKSKKIDVSQTRTVKGSRYPTPYHLPCAERVRQVLGEAAGLTQFGVNLLRLPPGSWSSQRHWHTTEDELIYILEGEVVLVTDSGEEILRAGDCAGFKAGVADGHHLQNRSDQEAVLLEIGTRSRDTDEAYYPDIDLIASYGPSMFRHRDGTPYPPEERKSAPPK
jgi:uncharacterized cupin superfamily protein